MTILIPLSIKGILDSIYKIMRTDTPETSARLNINQTGHDKAVF